MKELSREEQLRKQIEEMKEVSEKRKWQRTKKTFFVLTGAIYLIAFMCGEMGGDIKVYLEWLIISPVFAAIIMGISSLVYLCLTFGMPNYDKTIAKLEAELNAITFSEYE